LRKFGSRSARSAVLALALTAVVALSACTPWRPTAAEVDGSEIRTSEVADLSDVLRRDQAVTALIGSVVLGQSDPGEITDSRTLSDVSQFLLSQEIIDKVSEGMKGTRNEVEIYPGTHHGFAFPKRPVYDRDAAERHWERLNALYKRNLV